MPAPRSSRRRTSPGDASSRSATRTATASGSRRAPTLDPPPLVVPVDRLAPARQSRLPRLRRGGLPARVTARRPAIHRPARVHVRAGAGLRGRRRTAPVAGPGRKDAPPLARDDRRGVLRDVLLRVRHALRPRAGGLRTRRPRADATRAGALRVLGRPGAGAHPARIDRPRRAACDHTVPRRDPARALHRPPVRRRATPVIPLPHPSGASAWPYQNRALLERAVAAIRNELEAIETRPRSSAAPAR